MPYSHRLLIASVAAVLLAPTTGAAASDATLCTTLNTWSRTIGADARAVAPAAQRHHPDA